MKNIAGSFVRADYVGQWRTNRVIVLFSYAGMVTVSLVASLAIASAWSGIVHIVVVGWGLVAVLHVEETPGTTVRERIPWAIATCVAGMAGAAPFLLAEPPLSWALIVGVTLVGTLPLWMVIGHALRTR